MFAEIEENSMEKLSQKLKMIFSFKMNLMISTIIILLFKVSLLSAQFEYREVLNPEKLYQYHLVPTSKMNLVSYQHDECRLQPKIKTSGDTTFIIYSTFTSDTVFIIKNERIESSTSNTLYWFYVNFIPLKEYVETFERVNTITGWVIDLRTSVFVYTLINGKSYYIQLEENSFSKPILIK